VKAPGLLVTLFAIFLVPAGSSGQRAGFPNPPPPMDTENQTTTAQTPTLNRQVDMVQLQKEADELARTAQTIPDDMAALRKGTLPKDFIEKLKRIEKLSKRLRSQVTP
jgi:hypothetical protein